MTAKILDGRLLAQRLQEALAQQLKDHPRPPHLAVILVGDNTASLAYVARKQRACAATGIRFTLCHLPKESSQSAVCAALQRFNESEDINAILLQLPLPSHLNSHPLLQMIDPKKDVDGLHPLNMGKLALGEEGGFVPCTPLGVLRLLQENQVSLEHKQAVVVGRSAIVGRPLSILLSSKKMGGNATVTLAHSQSGDLKALCRQADILIAALGSRHFIGAEHVKPGAVVVDVGINRNEKGSLQGDVDFDAVFPIASAITPVPGGVGPMTIAMLLENTVKAWLLQRKGH